MKRFLNFWQEHEYGKVARCMVVLLALFVLLENVHVFPLHYMDAPIDRAIPFIPQFVWAYIAWFPYIIFSFFWFSVREKDEYMRLVKMIIIGWSAFIVFSFVYPTALSIRPDSVGSGLSARLCAFIYSVDSPTNVFPSMHVYATLCFAVAFTRRVASGRYIPALYRVMNPFLTLFIPLSTLFIKQHSLADVAASFVMLAILYVAVYRDPLHVAATSLSRALWKNK